MIAVDNMPDAVDAISVLKVHMRLRETGSLEHRISGTGAIAELWD